MHEAWGIILQHSTIYPHLQLVCKLLCVSKQLRAAIAAQCAGLVPLHQTVSREQAKQLQGWLSQHAILIGDLHLDYAFFSKSLKAAVEAGLQQAAAAAGSSLKVRSFDGAMSSATLQQLSSSYLTSLTLKPYPVTSSSDKEQFIEPLRRLTGLRSLSLQAGDVDAIMPAVAFLTQLTRLKLHSLKDVGSVEYLPPQLLELRLTLWDILSERPLNMGHLTGLTYLRTTQSFKLSGHVDMYGDKVVMPGDVLPPRLHTLVIAEDCSSLQPLQPLQHLRVLEVQDASTQAQELREWSTLTMLTELRLCYSCGFMANQAAGGWPVLSLLRRLVIAPPSEGDGDEAQIEAEAVAELGRLQGLTSLSVSNASIKATLGQVAAAVGRMTGLQQLQLCDNDYLDPPPADGDDDNEDALYRRQDVAAQQLTHAIAGLPRLEQLMLANIDLSNVAAAAEFRVATRLTKLCLRCCELPDFPIISCSCTLTGLVSLQLNGNPWLTDAVLPVVALQLQKLTALDLMGTDVTSMGLEYLTSLHACAVRVNTG